ncbi:transcriptional repressor LexA [Oxalobacter paraformigenes]|uniref:LexA repressor n=1 Tax=Oxalobacter paraformigenes TaxID=556268 RepID=C3X265_9BURK|nr:transcriptional repressor LexA [Oxalobacter paraformigenes]EEO27301.1 LexA repressor [Oxalobacter paraformigenes]
MIKLTARQQEILNLISQSIEKTGFPPTRAEIAAELGFRSVNAAEEHLQALARKGVIEIVPGISRGIRLVQDEGKIPVSETGRQGQYAVPLVGRVAAGSPILAQEHVEKTYQLDPALFSDKPDYLLKVRGLSMRDIGILEGDLIAVKKTEKARNGQIVVARLGDDVTVKRFKKTGSAIELLSENPDFRPIRVNRESDDFRIEGLVVGLLRTWQ